MINAINIAQTGLRAFQKKTEVIANNVANVNTDKFKKSQAVLSESKAGGVTASISQINTPGMPKEIIQGDQIVEVESSNVDIGEELVEMIPTTAGLRANVKTIQAQQDLLGTLLDIVQ